MKFEGVHISLCCEHCGERTSPHTKEYSCVHCELRCVPNDGLSDALMQIAERIKSMGKVELAKLLRHKEKPRIRPTKKCEACNGQGFTKSTMPSGKSGGKSLIQSMCHKCAGRGKVQK